jgi:hypothetical protein
MYRVVYFKPLDGIGECPLVLVACARRFHVVSQDRDHPDFPQDGVVDEIFYECPGRRWIRHEIIHDPLGGGEEFAEVNPKYVAECLVEAGFKLPPELEAAWEAVKSSQTEVWGMRVPNPFEPIEEAPRAQPAKGEAPQPAPMGSSPPAKRNQGKADRCRGYYLAFLERGEIPPSVAEIADHVGCSTGHASRALKVLENNRWKMDQIDARERHRDQA